MLRSCYKSLDRVNKKYIYWRSTLSLEPYLHLLKREAEKNY